MKKIITALVIIISFGGILFLTLVSTTYTSKAGDLIKTDNSSVIYS